MEVGKLSGRLPVTKGLAKKILFRAQIDFAGRAVMRPFNKIT